MKNNHKLLILIMVLVSLGSFFRLHRLSEFEPFVDEFYDARIAKDFYLNPNPFYKGDSYKFDDICNARLPFYIASASFAPLFSCFNFLFRSRIIFAIFGTLVILIAYFLGIELYNKSTGLLSALLIAISSYHISFSRYAISTGDITCSLFLISSMFFLFKGVKYMKPNLLLYAGIIAGLSSGSKFASLLIIPIALLYAYIIYRKEPMFSLKHKLHKDYILISVLNLSILIILIAFGTFLHNNSFNLVYANYTFNLYKLIILMYLFVLGVVLYKMPKRFVIVESGLILTNFVLLTIIFTFLSTPTHLFYNNIVHTLQWFKDFGYNNLENSRSFLLLLELINFKLLFPLNFLFFLGIIRAIKNINNKANSFVVIVILFFITFLSSTKWFLSYYLMPIIPFIFIVCAHEITVFFHSGKKLLRVLIVSILLINISYQFVNLNRISPYFNIDGYKLGRKFIGYNKPSFLLFEGLGSSVIFLEKAISKYSKVGVIFNLDSFRKYLKGDYDGFMHESIKMYSNYYSKDKTVDYSYIDNGELEKYNYIISSLIYPGKNMILDEKFEVIHVLRIKEIELFKIYKRIY